ncbi:hypothetical protein RI367_001027 [Sorochytrium milnesiophthora]
MAPPPRIDSSFASLHKMDCHPSVWSGFYKKALKERQQQLRLAFPHLFPSPPPAAFAAPSSTRSSFLLVGSEPASPAASPPASPSLDPRLAAALSSSSPGPLSDAHLASLSSSSVAGTVPGGSTTAVDDGFPVRGLDERIADNMVENCIGTMGLPVGLALNFTINSLPLVIPMAVEEPSVVAAVSGAAKTICGASVDDVGFTASASERNMITAQILLLDIADSDLDAVQSSLTNSKDTLISLGNSFIPSMAARGGGIRNITTRVVKRTANGRSDPALAAALAAAVRGSEAATSTCWCVVHVHIDVCDAMGANCASTVAEGLAPVIREVAGHSARVGLRIVTNLNTTRLSKASFRIPISALAYKSFPGHVVAARILEAYEWANDDPYRATTHNKGIMNGIDAVAVATGQDWRAVAAAAHSWAAGSGRADDADLAEKCGTHGAYRSLTHYWVEADERSSSKPTSGWFCGELELPICVGTRGGVLNTNPVYQYALGLMGNPNSQQLAMIMCAVGLAQNFAALRALTTEGIQKGHMHLHARNIAIAAGAPTHAIPEVTSWMITKNRINLSAATEYIHAHHLYTNLHKRIHEDEDNDDARRALSTPPSMFYFREKAAAPGNGDQKPFTLNIAFQSLGDKPVFLDFTDQSDANSIHSVLFGSKTYEWVMRIFPLMDVMQLSSAHSEDERANTALVRRLKVLTLILNVLVRRLMIWCPDETRSFVEKIFSHSRKGRSAGRNKRPGTPLASSSSSSSPRKRGASRDVSDRKPSISRSIQSILNSAQKYSAAAQQQQSHSPTRSGPSPTLVAVLNARSLHSKSGQEDGMDLTASGQFVFADLSASYTNSMDWVLPDSGIFRSDIFDDELHLRESIDDVAAADDKDDSAGKTAAYNNPLKPMMMNGGSVPTLTEVPTRRQILQVGLPLLLAIWQIFELWVTQYLGHVNLASLILEEQRLIVSSLVATTYDIASADVASLLDYSFDDLPSPAAVASVTESEQAAQALFHKFMSVHVKRAQCTLFMLVDLITCDPQHIKPALLTDIRAAGHYLEHQAAVAHDTARLPRDYNAIFGAMPLEQLGLAADSPHSPQLRFRRRSRFGSFEGLAQISAKAAAASSLTSPAVRQSSDSVDASDDALIALNIDGVRNSILTHAVFSRKAKALTSANAAASVIKPPSFADVNAHIPQYLATLGLDSLLQRIQAQLEHGRAPASPDGHAAPVITSGWLAKVSQELRLNFEFPQTQQR